MFTRRKGLHHNVQFRYDGVLGRPKRCFPRFCERSYASIIAWRQSERQTRPSCGLVHLTGACVRPFAAVPNSPKSLPPARSHRGATKATTNPVINQPAFDTIRNLTRRTSCSITSALWRREGSSTTANARTSCPTSTVSGERATRCWGLLL